MRFLVFLGGLFPLLLIVVSAGTLVASWTEISELAKLDFAKGILTGTLTMGSLSLTVLAYAISQIKSQGTTIQKAPYRYLAVVASFVILVSLSNAMVAAVFVLAKVPYFFEISLLLFYFVIVGVVVLVIYWMQKEFEYLLRI
jgi:hypothetical protein